MEAASEPANANVPVKMEEDEMISIISPSARAPQLKSLAKTVLSGDANVPKARVLIHELVDQGESDDQAAIKERIILVMSERSSDKMVEAFMQFQSWNSCPHDPIPAMPTANYADIYAAQLCDLMGKDGYKMVKDDVMGHSDVPDYLLENGLFRHTSLPSYMLQ